MASAEQIKALLKSHIKGDDEQFLSVAMQVAAHEAKLGHGKLEEARWSCGPGTRPPKAWYKLVATARRASVGSKDIPVPATTPAGASWA